MDSNDLDVLARRQVFQGYFRMEEWRIRHRLFEGGWSNEITRECLERGHAVAVLPYDPVRDEVVLIEQLGGVDRTVPRRCRRQRAVSQLGRAGALALVD